MYKYEKRRKLINKKKIIKTGKLIGNCVKGMRLNPHVFLITVFNFVCFILVLILISRFLR